MSFASLGSSAFVVVVEEVGTAGDDGENGTGGRRAALMAFRGWEVSEEGSEMVRRLEKGGTCGDAVEGSAGGWGSVSGGTEVDIVRKKG